MKHPDSRLAAYRDLLVAAPVSVTSVRRSRRGRGRARRRRARGRPARRPAGARAHRRRRLRRRQPGHPDRARNGHPRRPARGDGRQVRLPAPLRRGAVRRRAGSSTTAPRTSAARPAATHTTSSWRARWRRRLSRRSCACPWPAPAATCCCGRPRPSPAPLAEIAAAVGGELADSVVVGDRTATWAAAASSRRPPSASRDGPGMAAKHPLMRVRSRP